MVKIIAHRGFSGMYPENTRLAFDKALDQDCDAIEIDVQLSKDGVPLLYHDDDLQRLVKVSGYLADNTWQEIENYRVQKRVRRISYLEPILSLESYFIWFKDHEITTVIELKNNVRQYDGLEEILIALAQKYSLVEKIIFSSFNKGSLIKLKKLCPEARCGYITKLKRNEDLDWITQYQVDYIHPKYTSLWPWNLYKIAKLGIPISPWTVNHYLPLFIIAHLRNVYGIITDRPDRLRRILNYSPLK